MATAKRKTVNLVDIVEAANTLLRNSDDNMTAERDGIAMLTSRILHDTDTYAGFRYIGGWPTDDETRIQFYGPKQ